MLFIADLTSYGTGRLLKVYRSTNISETVKAKEF